MTATLDHITQLDDAITGTASAPAGQEPSHDQRPYWQAEPCPAWCPDPEGHEDIDHPDDRICMTGGDEVILSLHDSPVTVTAAGELLADTPNLRVYLEQGWREREPRIAVNLNEHDCFCLTLAEAEQLAEVLSAWVAEARRS